MLALHEGTEILQAVGGISSVEVAAAFLNGAVDDDDIGKLRRIRNGQLLLRIANAVSVCQPDRVFVHSGSREDLEYVRSMSVQCGEEFRIKTPGHTCHFDLPEDQGRIVDRTYYIVNEEEPVSVLSKKMERVEALDYIRQEMTGIMSGKTMIVGIYSRGPIGSPAAIPAVEMTDSFYVVHSADLLYANAFESIDDEIERVGEFFTNLHSMGRFRSEDSQKARVFMDRSWLTTFSMHCTYAGNTLMLKKGNHRFAVDRAVYFQAGKQLSEHMFITGLTGPGGRRTFFAGAAPSGCGKTTTAMVGSDLIGDDLAQLWIHEDGTIHAINPETGVFGIVQDVNAEGDPLLMRVLGNEGSEVIWSNILINDDGRPRWVGDGEKAPAGGRNWLGRWTPDAVDASGKSVPISHANARFTFRSDSLSNYSRARATNPEGVPVEVITYSGRDSDTMPPVWVAKTPQAGVVIGASILSAATATEVGVSGVKRQPWANAAFIPGPLADYMKAQFAFFASPRLSRKPVIAGLNYFLTESAREGEGNDLLGEKRDVIVWLSWLERYAHHEMTGIETPIGIIPRYSDLKALFADIIGKEYSRGLYDRQFSIYVEKILMRIDYLEDAYRHEAGIPDQLFDVYRQQRESLEMLKTEYGPVVAPMEAAEYAHVKAS